MIDGILDGGEKSGVFTHGVIIVDVFVSEGDRENALRDDFVLMMIDENGISRIGNATIDFFDKMDFLVDGLQESNSGVGGEVSAVEIGLDFFFCPGAANLEFSGAAQENLDVYHALEYLSNKGDALYGKETAEHQWWFETMRRDILDGGVKPVLERVRLMQSMEQLDKRKEVLRVLENYLVFHSARMNYRERLAQGKSIGSGQVEGACKNLIGRRLKQTGAKWKRERVDRMAVLCAVLYSNQWKDYWKTAK